MAGFLSLLVTLLIIGFATVCAIIAKWFGTKNDLDPRRCFSLGLMLGPIGVVTVVVQSSQSRTG